MSFRSICSTETSLAIAQLEWLQENLGTLLEQIQLEQVSPDELEHRLQAMRTQVERALAGGAK